MPPELKHKLKKALSGRSSVDMGQFQFLNLDRVREEAGPDWDRLREKIYEVGIHFIEKRLGGNDVAIRCRGGFLIIFEALDGEAAQEAVAAIAEELEQFFLGDRVLQHLEVTGEARSVTTEELLEIVAKTQDEGRPRPPAAPPADDDDISEPAPPWARQEAGDAYGEGPGTHWVEAPNPERRPQPAAAVRADKTDSDSNKAWDDIVFRPCWDARKSMLLHNVCIARRVVKGFVYYGRDTLMGSEARDMHRRLDQSVAKAAQRGFQKAYSQGGPSAVIVPVHYDTISSVSQRMQYFSILQSVPEPMRRFFFLRVDSIPDGAPLGQMQELFRSMKHFGAYVLAHLKYGVTDLKRFEGCGIGIFAAETPARFNAGGPDPAGLTAMSDWVASARLMKAETGLTQVDGLAMLDAGLSAGVRYFSGTAIAPERPLPVPVQPLTLADIQAGGGQGAAIPA